MAAVPAKLHPTNLPVANSLPIALMVAGADGDILYANPAAEQFFAMGLSLLLKQRLGDLLPADSALFQLIIQARQRNSSASERDLELMSPRYGLRVADVTVTPMPDPEGALIISLQERVLALRMDRQLSQRGAVRSLNGMASVLAHEIKNPLAGIRGAAQLLEDNLSAPDREMTQLIVAEADRIRAGWRRPALRGAW